MTEPDTEPLEEQDAPAEAPEDVTVPAPEPAVEPPAEDVPLPEPEPDPVAPQAPVVEGSPEQVLDATSRAAVLAVLDEGDAEFDAAVARYKVKNRNFLLPALASTFGVEPAVLAHLFDGGE